MYFTSNVIALSFKWPFISSEKSFQAAIEQAQTDFLYTDLINELPDWIENDISLYRENKSLVGLSRRQFHLDSILFDKLIQKESPSSSNNYRDWEIYGHSLFTAYVMYKNAVFLSAAYAAADTDGDIEYVRRGDGFKTDEETEEMHKAIDEIKSGIGLTPWSLAWRSIWNSYKKINHRVPKEGRDIDPIVLKALNTSLIPHLSLSWTAILKYVQPHNLDRWGKSYSRSAQAVSWTFYLNPDLNILGKTYRAVRRNFGSKYRDILFKDRQSFEKYMKPLMDLPQESFVYIEPLFDEMGRVFEKIEYLRGNQANRT